MLDQVIAVDPNKPFIFSGDFNIEALSNAKVQIYVEFYSLDNGNHPT
jgi:hypothetical protein